jgi:hypothetical protein
MVTCAPAKQEHIDHFTRPRASIDLREIILAASGFARRAFLLERAQSSTVSPDFAEDIFDPPTKSLTGLSCDRTVAGVIIIIVPRGSGDITAMHTKRAT